MVKRWSFFASVLFVSLMLVPTGAHLLALPNKIAMSAQDYLAAQQAYRGWAYAGAIVCAATASIIVFAWSSRRSRSELTCAMTALVCLLLSQIAFWLLNYPANDATENWTKLPSDWERLRLQWEIGHAAGAVLTLAALVALLLAYVQRDARITARPVPYPHEALRL
jgi:hypothetical protein